MEMKLYISKSGDNVINKNMLLIHTVDIKLKINTSIVNPTIILSDIAGVDLLKCNYAYIEKFNRYYFIRSIEVEKGLYNIFLECDVIESFNADILASKAEYVRGIKEGDFLNFNDVTDLRKEIDDYTSSISLEDGSTIILSTIGGGDS